MIRALCKKNWRILVLNILLLVIFISFYGRFGDVYVDSFREAYIPAQMLKGQILYENIFSIYAPFAYLFNTLLFFLFGVKLKILYMAGFFTTIGILNLLYKIANKFMAKTYSFIIVLFVISVSVLSPNVFNMFFPYSFGILYGLLFTLGSIYCVINKKFFWAYFLYSLAICSKYEFALLLPVILFAGYKNFNLKNISGFFIPLFFVFIPLFLSGLSVESFITSIRLLVNISSAKTLHWFYSVSGLIFRIDLIPVYIVDLAKILIPLLILQKYKSKILYIVLFVYLYFVSTPDIFIYLCPLVLILLCFRYKNLSYNKKFLVVSSLAVSIKVFFALTFLSYGIFFIPLVMLSLFILVPPKYKKNLAIIILMLAFWFAIKNSAVLFNKNFVIKTPNGAVKTFPHKGQYIKELTEIIIKDTHMNDTVLIFPECLAVNFLSNRNSDNKFYSLIPMYVETFGEDLITERIMLKNPEYIVVSDYDTSNYYFSKFGKDYAQNIYEHIKNNYNLKNVIGENDEFLLYNRTQRK